MIEYQLDFFKTQEECEKEAMFEYIESIKISTDKVRKSLFAKNGELSKKIIDLELRLEIIERNICKS